MGFHSLSFSSMSLQPVRGYLPFHGWHLVLPTRMTLLGRTTVAAERLVESLVIVVIPWHCWRPAPATALYTSGPHPTLIALPTVPLLHRQVIVWQVTRLTARPLYYLFLWKVALQDERGCSLATPHFVPLAVSFRSLETKRAASCISKIHRNSTCLFLDTLNLFFCLTG